MATADGDFNAECWNEICEDAECDDTKYHATVEELLQRIQDVGRTVRAVDVAEDIILQEELRYRTEGE